MKGCPPLGAVCRRVAGFFRTALVFALAAAACLAADVPAFPGAEGFGAGARGGRGGKVLLVTNLNDSGPGSLRAACETKGPRIIVFRVAGIIDLKTPIRISEPFLTIAGHSAPGDGVCLRGQGISINADNVIVRFLRSRPGDVAGGAPDGLSVGGTAKHVILDHCSVSWGSDENLSASGAISDITVQWCLIAEGLNRNLYSKGAHGYGSLCRAQGGVTLHHNLWAHNSGRNPRIGDNYGRPPFPTYDIRNNVMYNFEALSIVGDTLEANYVGNYILPGPSTPPSPGLLMPTDAARLRFFLSGNLIEGRDEITSQQQGLFRRLATAEKRLVEILAAPLGVPAVVTQPAPEAYELVLARAGAILPVRDAVDMRIVTDVRARSGAIIDSQWEVGGWPVYRPARPPVDSDRDGMPDAWEIARGLGPRNPADSAADRDGDGYTNIEEYLNGLAAAGLSAAPR